MGWDTWDCSRWGGSCLCSPLHWSVNVPARPIFTIFQIFWVQSVQYDTYPARRTPVYCLMIVFLLLMMKALIEEEVILGLLIELP